jgi:4-hydroxybenzoate polyprenyltransferase
VGAAPAAGGAAERGTLRAWLEVLRAPLLLSPCADVLAGWSVGFQEGLGYGRVFRPLTGQPAEDVFARASFALAGWPVLLRALLVGMCLLAAGMAQNAVADAEEDRRTKPSRPIPRGALSRGAVHAAWITLSAIALSIAATLGGKVLVIAGTIVALTAVYHAGLKRHRVAGCLVLGTLRGFDMALGGYALLHAARAAAPGSDAAALHYANLDDLGLLVPLYAGYITCASLHASTDDQPGRSPWSTAGVLACVALLLLLAGLMLAPLLRSEAPLPHRWLAPALLVIAALRLLRAWRIKPPPAITGAALSNIYFFGAAVVLMGQHTVLAIGGAALLLALFGASRLALRVVPPS